MIEDYNPILNSIASLETMLRIEKRLNRDTYLKEISKILDKNNLKYDTIVAKEFAHSCGFSILVNNESLQNWLFRVLTEK